MSFNTRPVVVSRSSPAWRRLLVASLACALLAACSETEVERNAGWPGCEHGVRSRLSRWHGEPVSRRAGRTRPDEDPDDARRPLRRERRGAAARLGAVEDGQRSRHLHALLRRRRRRTGRLHRHHARTRQGADPGASPRRGERTDPGNRAAGHPHRSGGRIREAHARIHCGQLPSRRPHAVHERN